jgi:hypothetical protein
MEANQFQLYSKYNSEYFFSKSVDLNDLYCFEERCALILGLHTFLQKKVETSIPVKTILEEIITKFDYKPFIIVWILNCIYYAGKRNILCDLAKHELFIEMCINRSEFEPSYKFKIGAAICRLKHTSPRINAFIQELADSNESRVLLSSMVSEDEVVSGRADSLGLVAKSVIPFVRIFLMRYALMTMSFDVLFERWQASIGLISLFNIHEGLLYKMLLGTLRIGDDCALLNPPQLYRDLLYRINYDVKYLIGSSDQIPNVLVYLYRFHKRYLISDWVKSGEEYEFYVELLEYLVKNRPDLSLISNALART